MSARRIVAGLSAAALLGVVALGAQGCLQVIGAGDYKVDPGAGCATVFMGVAYNGSFIADGSFISSVQLRNDAGAPDGTREFRVRTAPALGVAQFAAAPALDLNNCLDCAWIFEWENGAAQPTRAWFAVDGYLDTQQVPTDQSGRAIGSLGKVRFVEATFDNATGWATAVDQGACLYLAAGDFSVHTCNPKAPDCNEGEACQAFTNGGGICQVQ